MKIFKYISIILVTIWVVFYSNDSRAEDLVYKHNGIIMDNYDNNELKARYFHTVHQIERKKNDINFYRNRRLELMRKGDFSSEAYNRLSTLIKTSEYDKRNMENTKNSLGVTYKVRPEAKYLEDNE